MELWLRIFWYHSFNSSRTFFFILKLNRDIDFRTFWWDIFCNTPKNIFQHFFWVHPRLTRWAQRCPVGLAVIVHFHFWGYCQIGACYFIHKCQGGEPNPTTCFDESSRCLLNTAVVQKPLFHELTLKSNLGLGCRSGFYLYSFINEPTQKYVISYSCEGLGALFPAHVRSDGVFTKIALCGNRLSGVTHALRRTNILHTRRTNKYSLFVVSGEASLRVASQPSTGQATSVSDVWDLMWHGSRRWGCHDSLCVVCTRVIAA